MSLGGVRSSGIPNNIVSRVKYQLLWAIGRVPLGCKSNDLAGTSLDELDYVSPKLGAQVSGRSRRVASIEEEVRYTDYPR